MMSPFEQWQRSTADFLFYLVVMLIILLVFEVFTDLHWKLVWAGIGVYYVLFCFVHVPHGYKRLEDGQLVEKKQSQPKH